MSLACSYRLMACPRLGATGPLLMQYRDQKAKVRREEKPTNPRHRLGVASLPSTHRPCSRGKHSPEGILYSGGRDGLLMSWDLSMPMKRRGAADSAPSRSRQRSWELMTGWGRRRRRGSGRCR